jgi:lysophospholipase L1-like esterase
VYARAWQTDNVEAAGTVGPLWVVLGDSLSQGIGASSYRCGWVGRADAALRERGRHYRIINLSRTGATTSEVLHDQLDAMRALGEEPTLVTLLVGANDMLRRTTRHSLSDNFQAVLSQLPAQTVVAYLPQPVALARQVNRLIDERAASTGLHPVSVRPAARHFRGHRAADLFHPNDRGYQRLADIVVPAILEVEDPAAAAQS